MRRNAPQVGIGRGQDPSAGGVWGGGGSLPSEGEVWSDGKYPANRW